MPIDRNAPRKPYLRLQLLLLEAAFILGSLEQSDLLQLGLCLDVSCLQPLERARERMLELKRERMGTFVENARAEIVRLWDELMVSEEERADFAPFADGEVVA